IAALLLGRETGDDPEPVPHGQLQERRARADHRCALDAAEARRRSAATRWTSRSSPRARAAPVALHARQFPVLGGRITGLTGWLGAFELRWEANNPINLGPVHRCNACVAACGEDAMRPGLPIDLAACSPPRLRQGLPLNRRS
ncbi:MAG: 4Fe-4S ferredoxin, partial [Comamonadaceae bacterium]|nr:4Fe-4S ferredoxin [Comamonadaceae bacterium]